MTVQIAETDKYILTIEYDPYPGNPREWDNLGTMVCWHSRYNLGDSHHYESPRDFLESLAQEFEHTESGQRVIKNRAEKEMENYHISFSEEENKYIIKSRSEYNYFDPYLFDSHEEAAWYLKEYKQDLIDDPDWNEFTDQELWDIIHPNVVILPLYLYDHGNITIRTSSFSDHWDSGQVGWIYAPKEVLLQETGYTEDELFSLDHKPNRAEQLLKSEVEIYDQYLNGEVYGYRLKEKKKCEHCGHITEELVDSCWGFYGDDFKNNGLFYYIPEEFHFLAGKLEYV